MYEKLFAARAKWRDMGGVFGLDNDTLNDISIKYGADVQDCLREMIAKRLESVGPLSLKDLCECLRNPTVRRHDVADMIEQEIGRLAHHN